MATENTVRRQATNPLEATLRAFALTYPEAHEDFPWEGDRVIKVRGKIFVFMGGGIGVKLTHSNQAALGRTSRRWATGWVAPAG